MGSDFLENEDLRVHLGFAVEALKKGTIVPFLGAGANLVDRLGGEYDPSSHTQLPSGTELARYLAEAFNLSTPEADSLVRVALNIALHVGEGPLYESLREIFDADYPPTSLHHLLARLPRLLLERGGTPLQIVVTTNYDDCLERAFASEGEDIDVLTYMAVGRSKGMFVHLSPDGNEHVIEPGIAHEYAGLAINDEQQLLRPVVLKLHGAVDRQHREGDSYVITEDDYLEYMALGNIVDRLPATVSQKLNRSNFLFLGYSLRDWNLRAVLGRIWAKQHVSYKSWAIQYRPSRLDRKAWDKKGVEIFDAPLDLYVTELGKRIEDLPVRSVPADV